METRELQAVVNPVYTTAKGTIMMLTAGGDPDARKLAPYLDLSEVQKGGSATPPEIRRCYIVAQEASGSFDFQSIQEAKNLCK